MALMTAKGVPCAQLRVVGKMKDLLVYHKNFTEVRWLRDCGHSTVNKVCTTSTSSAMTERLQ